MNLSPPITILAIVTAAFGAMIVAKHIRVTDRREESCAAALAYLQHVDRQKTKPLLVYDEGIGGASHVDIARALSHDPNLAQHPDFEIYKHAANIEGVSPVRECENVLGWLGEHNIAHHPRTVVDAMLRPHSGFNGEVYPWEVVSISMPAISGDGRRSIFDSSIYGADLGGASYSVEMRRDQLGKWVVEKISILSIS